MLLIKCKCGCLFTIKDNTIPNPPGYLRCQNCGIKVPYYPDRYELSSIQSEFNKAEMTVQKIPDDSDITVTFKA